MADEADAPEGERPTGGLVGDVRDSRPTGGLVGDVRDSRPTGGLVGDVRDSRPTGGLVDWELARDPDAAWRKPPPGRLLGKGHPTGDFLEAHEWLIVEERPGYYQLEGHLPNQVRNLRGELFGGFSPTYVDLLSLRTVVAARDPDAPRGRLVTVSMHVDYFAPVTGPRFLLECEVRHRRGKNWLVETRFRDLQGVLLLLAMTTIRDMA